MTPSIPVMTDRDLCVALSTASETLPAKDRDFALSLVDSVRQRGMVGASTKQRYWLEHLLERARNGEPERIKTKVGEFAGLTALFDKAAKHLKAPAVVIGIAGQEIRLSVAGAKARAPGSINVATNTSWDARTWFGRILATGEFEASPRDPTPAGMVEGLVRFAADPAGVAAEHGRLTGRCCFCDRSLTDERSTAVGYGKTCAGNFGLSYPTLTTAREMAKAA